MPAGVAPVEPGAAKVNFADALKNLLGEVSAAQKSAGEMGKRFTMGDESVSLSEVMVSIAPTFMLFSGVLPWQARQ